MKKKTENNAGENSTTAGGAPPENVPKKTPKKRNKVVVNKEEHIQEKTKGDEYEYDYEGDMAMSQLKSIMMNAKQLHDMLEPNTNLPEWVQSKITLAKDYIETARDYLQTQMKEEFVTEGKALTFQQRLARARQMRRNEPKVYRGQMRYLQKVPSEARLIKRAEREARNVIRLKLMHTPYDQLSVAEKIMIDKLLQMKGKAIKKLAVRLLPKIRKRSLERLTGKTSNRSGNTNNPGMPIQKIRDKNAVKLQTKNLYDSAETIYSIAKGEETPAVKSLQEKAQKAGVTFEKILTVYSKALQEYTPGKITSEQYAFNAVNSFVANKINEDFKKTGVNQLFSEMTSRPPPFPDLSDPLSLAAVAKYAFEMRYPQKTKQIRGAASNTLAKLRGKKTKQPEKTPPPIKEPKSKLSPKTTLPAEEVKPTKRRPPVAEGIRDKMFAGLTASQRRAQNPPSEVLAAMVRKIELDAAARKRKPTPERPKRGDPQPEDPQPK